ncbi:hypothetical protein BURMUCGD2M_0077 [Burkholderia multivorans CGD2M]|uniref:Uncharacterized protein n=1 Tax=Burkholderia multivorans CGD2 TaxID=513052 RepID=B9BZJ1_9BURK|nr:hypothetical protein BURMUCGD2_0077 [Burkholderia multivorans CGD2]EEE10363.1 hypothetical protein BURMUCGD2M_0077 [Burkholderia multivorans CGD2M]
MLRRQPTDFDFVLEHPLYSFSSRCAPRALVCTPVSARHGSTTHHRRAHANA